jgi:hypothetical protein
MLATQNKGDVMKISIYLLITLMFFVCLPAVNAQEYGQIRALQQRAAAVIKQKNDFVSKVLTSYKIPHERNVEGAVVRIHKDNQWLDVTTIEIVPLLKEATGERRQVAAHQLLFYTSGGILDLVAEVIIR